MLAIQEQEVCEPQAAPLPTRFRCSGSWVKPSSVQLPVYHEIYSRYIQMSNEDLLDEETMIKTKYYQFLRHDMLDEANKLVPHNQILAGLINYGYRKGEKVHRRTSTMWIEDTILEVDGNCLMFRSVNVPPSLVRKITEDNIEEARKMVSYD